MQYIIINLDFLFFFIFFGLYIGFEQVVESIAFNEGPNFILDR